MSKIRFILLPFFAFLLLSTSSKIDSSKTQVLEDLKSYKLDYSNPLLSCTQSDLIICNYSTILDFVDALVAELNNQLNNCPARNWDCNPNPCCLSYAIFSFTSLPSGLSKNPYFYCSDESCNSFTCSASVPGGGSQHNDLSVSDQNAIISQIKARANGYKNYACAPDNTPGNIYSYTVFRQVSGGTSCSADGPCFNIEIQVRVYYSCPCGGNN